MRMSLDDGGGWAPAPGKPGGCARAEPRLEQLLADPLIRLMMASDRVSEDDLRRLAARPRARGYMPGPGVAGPGSLPQA